MPVNTTEWRRHAHPGASERPDGSGRTVLEFRAGAGGLHSAEN